jgi:hypothetical protein
VTNYVYDGANAIEEVDASENLLAKYSQGAGIDQTLSELRSGAISSGRLPIITKMPT